MQVVKGLGETLVGAYSGRALSFVAKKSDIKNPKVCSHSAEFAYFFLYHTFYSCLNIFILSLLWLRGFFDLDILLLLLLSIAS